MKRSSFVAASLVAALIQTVQAAETDISVTPSGGVYFQFGQLVKTTDELTLPNKTWDQRFDFRFSLNAQVRKNLRIIVGAELAGVTQVQPPKDQGSTGKTTTTYYVYPREGQGIYYFGEDEANPLLQIALGYFPFKYNPQASNMGEYLFRTSIYPSVIINDFDNCQARLMGLRLSSTLFGSLRQDLLITSEVLFQPIGDYSLSYLVSYKPFPVLEIGGGICESRLLPLDPELTTPKEDIVYDKNGNAVLRGGDTLHYTYQGTKMMGRFTFDPKPLLPEWLTGLLGKEDGKLYAETAILGVKNYGAVFDNILKRWPYMFGFNIPGFKMLDVLAFEMEYFNNPYDKYKLPVAYTVPSQAVLAPDQFSVANRVHWSFFAQKTIAKGFSVKGLIGKDHYRQTGSTSNQAIMGADALQNSNDYGGEMLINRGDWHYSLRTMFSF